MNVLAIDDNPDILKLLDTVITSKGHKFTQVLKGKGTTFYFTISQKAAQMDKSE